MSAADASIQNKIHGYGRSSNSILQKTVKFSNEDIKYMTKIVKALEDSDFLMKGVTETCKSNIKKRWCFTFDPNVIRNSWRIFVNWKRFV